ncbi:MAG: hypothetical protein ACR2FY_07750 [Pirellulaceae bacterium]
MKSKLFSTIAMLLFVTSAAQAQDWGSLKARFILDGKAPIPAKANINKDIEVCGKHKLVDETFKINAESGAIQNVVIYLSPKPGAAKPKIHPDYDKAPANVVLDNHNCHFEPHIVIVRTTQKLVVKNTDSVGHNTKADFFNNTAFNDLIPSGGSITKSLTKPESAFMPISCSIHPWMSAKILVREDPYAAVSDEKGELTIENLPAGKWTFTIWHEGCGFVTSGKKDGKATEWKKGKIDIDIKKGVNDLGEIKIPVNILTKTKS